MFDRERFIDDCRLALNEKDARGAIQALVERAVADPAGIVRALGEPRRAGVETIHKASDLTILNLCWGPHMRFHPHNHQMWAVIGIYGGREDNTFYRRGEAGLIQHGTRQLNTGDAVPLGESIIHAVTNPLDQITGAIHVYGGNFFETARSEWDPDTHTERPYDVQHTMRKFEESNHGLPG
jgi:predicted metal-dependent enzyme (double-stranded beta helix superfamily)